MRKLSIDAAALIVICYLAAYGAFRIVSPAADASGVIPVVYPGADIISCTKLADEAGVPVTGGMSVQAAQALMLRALMDHGLVAPRASMSGNDIEMINGVPHRVIVSRITERDIQGAADEVKPCFPAK